MNKLTKYLLLGTGIVGLLFAGTAAYISATFNPNDYKAQLIKLVQDKKQRTLKLDGDIQLTFFPKLGANLGKIALSEHNSDKEFASVDNLRVSLALLPLLSRQMVVDEVTLSGLKATLVKFKDGKSNIDDLLSKDENKTDPAAGAAIKLDIAAVLVEKTELTYRDESSGAQYALKAINLKTGHVAEGIPIKLELSASIQSTQPKLDLTTQLKTQLTFRLDQPQYRLEGLDFQAKGAMSGMGDIAATLAAADLETDLQTLKSSMLTLGFDMKQPEQSFNVKLSSPVSGEFKAQKFALPNLSVAIKATGDKLPNKSVSSEMKGSVQLDATQQNIKIELMGGLLQSQIKAKVAVNNFADPAIRFDVDIDQFDADLYIPKTADTQQGKPAAEQAFDLSALKSLNAEGSLRIGQLKVANIKLAQLRLEVKAHKGQLSINPLSSKLYNGSMNGSVTVTATQASPAFTINENLSGISVGALIKDAADFDMLEGKGNVALNLNTHGNTVTVLKKSLAGNMALSLADGSIKGINLAKTLRGLSGVSGAQTQAASKEEKTDFSELKASFKVSNGIAHNDDLALKSPLLRLAGNGDINIGESSINYLAKATLAKTLEGQGGKDAVGGITVPVRLRGPFSDLKYTLDLGAMVTDTVKQKAQEEIHNQLQEGLKGLFQ